MECSDICYILVNEHDFSDNQNKNSHENSESVQHWQYEQRFWLLINTIDEQW